MLNKYIKTSALVKKWCQVLNVQRSEKINHFVNVAVKMESISKLNLKENE